MTFWEHLDELRTRLWRVLLVAIVAMVACFCFKEQLFAVVMYPKPDWLQLINVELTQQFLTHMRVALWAGLVVVSPYIIYQMFAFVAPGLYAAERRLTVRAVGAGYLLFLAGVALNYFVVFPFTVRFLGGYQVSASVQNTITLSSYISVLGVMSLVMGMVFELPVLCWLLAKMGVLKASFMKRYRRHAIVVIVILGAIITPTGDPFTLSLVAVPIYLLWELSILIVKHVER
ncbi:MAG: twin-arginine translocase subunit TatC [Bacteroidales bacterium]|nr:twin-arginine translocase subunit TatC [Bacteroidales bacterium]